MSRSPEEIQLGHMSVTDRMLLAHALVESAIAELHAGPVAPDQLEEIRRCDAAVDTGDMQCETWDVVRRRLFVKP